MIILVPKEVLQRTPSREDGIRQSIERRARAFGVELIQRATILLRLPQTTGVSAAAILQRFYFRRSLADFDVRVAAPAALLLACKLEETHRSLRDIVLVFHRLRMRRFGEDNTAVYAGIPTPALEPGSSDAAQMKQAVISTERHMLRELGFAVASILEHPHKYVLQFVKSLKKSTDWVLCELAQAAWNYLNDSMRTVLCCEYQPHEIASASIYLAARKLGVKFPQEPPWWTVFDTEQDTLRRIAGTIVALYTRRPMSEAEVSTLVLVPTLVDYRVPPVTPLPLPSPLSDEGPGGAASETGSARAPPLSAAAEDPSAAAAIAVGAAGGVEPAKAPRDRSRSRERFIVID